MGNQQASQHCSKLFIDELPDKVENQKLGQMLHRSIGALTFLGKYGHLDVGTAVLISKDVVLTAASNIFDKRHHAQNKGFKFVIGGVHLDIKEWRYPPEFKNSFQQKSISFDFAIMKLKEPIKRNRYIPLSIPCGQCVRLKELSLFGYHSAGQSLKKTNKYEQKTQLYQCGLTRIDSNAVIDNVFNKLKHKISALPGQRGCPIVMENEVIAVHIGGLIDYNVGRTVDISFVEKVAYWIRELKVDHFELGKEKKCPHRLILCGQGLQTIDLVDYANVMKLDLSQNRLNSVNIKDCPLLKIIRLSQNQLHQVDVSSNANLIHLDISRNQLQKIDITSNIKLETINLTLNKIAEIDVSYAIKLRILMLRGNKLTSIDLSNNENLIQLQIGQNSLSQIDLSNNKKLTQILLQQNKIEHIDLSNNYLLEYLYLYNNCLVQIDLSNNRKLNQLMISSNRFKKIAGIFIAKNAKIKDKVDCFNFSNQQSQDCIIQLSYEEEQTRGTANEIAEKWRQQYSCVESNKYGCKYNFVVLQS